MIGSERSCKVIATVFAPAVLEYDHDEKGLDWRYSAIRFVVTDKCDPFIITYLRSIVRT